MARAASAPISKIDSLSCPHYQRGCAGCTREEELLKPSQYVDAREVFSSYGFPDLPLVSTSIKGWRCRAKLAVRGSHYTGTLIGLFERGTHDVVDIVDTATSPCVIQHPRINAASREIKATFKKLSVAPYNEATRKGLVRYIQLTAVGSKEADFRAELDVSASVQVVLVVNCSRKGKDSKAARDLARDLWKRGEGGLFHSIWVNFHQEEDPKRRSNDNVILGGGGFELVRGAEQVIQRFTALSSPISIGPGAFVQANYGTFSLALTQIRDFALEKKDAKVLELHAGVGSIGLSLFSNGQGPSWLRCVEINPAGEDHFQRSKSILLSQIRASGGSIPDVGYLVAPASDEQCLRWLKEDVDVIIVDPPKKGLERELLTALTSSNAEQGDPGRAQTQTLIYLSCGWEALKKEMGLLVKSGWKLVFSSAYLFFPGTEAIETLAVFKR